MPNIMNSKHHNGHVQDKFQYTICIFTGSKKAQIGSIYLNPEKVQLHSRSYRNCHLYLI